jgi:hypothetical protein
MVRRRRRRRRKRRKRSSRKGRRRRKKKKKPDQLCSVQSTLKSLFSMICSCVVYGKFDI